MSAQSSLPEAWFAKAEADLEAAKLLLNASNPLIEIVCYHAQQCAEKYLKGYLVAKNIPFRFVHELAYLNRLCMQQEPDFSDLMDLVAELQDYATSVRYPDDDMETLSIPEAERAVDCATTVRSFVRQILSQEQVS